MCRFWRRLYRFSFLFLVGFVLCLTLGIFPIRQTPVVAQSNSAEQLVRSGIEQYKAGKFNEAIALWQQVLSQIKEAPDRAAVHSNLALAYRQIGQLTEAIEHWEQAIQIYQRQDDETKHRQLPKLLTEQAQAYNELGQHRRAITLLQSALELARQNKDLPSQAGALGTLGNAYWALGNYEQALDTHQASLQIARQLNSPDYIATSLNNLGNVYISRSQRYRYQANTARVEGDNKENARLTQLAEQELTAARSAFEQSLRESQALGSIAQVKALLNLNRLLEQLPGLPLGDNVASGSAALTPDWVAIGRNREQALALVETLPDSRDKVYVLINLAESFRRQALAGSGENTVQLTSPPTPLLLGEGSKAPPFPAKEGGLEGLGLPYSNRIRRDGQGRSSTEALLLLSKAINIARSIGDRRAESYALGSLGQIYQLAGQVSAAMELTQQAQLAAGQVNAPQSLYRWQWQAGRLLKVTGKTKDAIASYEQAIATLQSIRSNLLAANTDLQFDFRDSVEPVYRELMQLLLEPSAVSGQEQQTTNLSKVIDILELLKLAELQNFFGDECVEIAQANAESEVNLVDAGAVIIYSVILSDRTEMIMRLPDGHLTSHTVLIKQEQIQQDINQLRQFLEKRATEEYLIPAQKIYDALIRPLEPNLTAANPKTLVFIQDGVLREVPMAALHDGQQFLIKKYAIATTPSLSLTSRTPAVQHYSGALIMGLTVERPPFKALANVRTEVDAVQAILGGTELLDRDFTLATLQAQLQKKRYPVVHIATHGKFGVDTASTFLLSFDSRITLEQIDEVLRAQNLLAENSRRSQQPLELLTLSACQTATGDNRAALGIAGVAVRAGVRSALASLWNINDEATVPLIQEFYTQLRQPNVTKAEALQKAQLKMIADLEYSHPAVWSPFILIGNWL